MVTELCCAISRAANTPSSPQGVDRDCAMLSDEVDVGRMREDEPEGHVSSFLYFGCIVSETHTAVLSDSFHTLAVVASIGCAVRLERGGLVSSISRGRRKLLTLCSRRVVHVHPCIK